MRGGPVAQHLNALDGSRRDCIQVRAGCAAADRVVDMDQCRLVAPFAIHEHERLIGTEATQGGGT